MDSCSYRVEGVLGSGGFGITSLVWDTNCANTYVH
jgi:hypothetical protein